jgi:ATP-dependent RNA helicase RhlE
VSWIHGFDSNIDREPTPSTAGGFVTFASLGLPPAILKGIRAAGLTDPTAIQSKAIPTILQGNDLIGAAQSGSGKTGAYLIPILARLLDSSTRLRALILVPTRELAAYVETRTRDYARYTEVKVGVVFTGAPLQAQERMLREQPVDILVSTPGRLLELAERKCVNFENIEILVLEEADRMVALGLAPDLRKLLKLLPETRQTLLFSVTMPPELNRLAKEALIEPVRVDMAPATRPVAGINQGVYPVPRDLKADLLDEMLARAEVRSTVIFTRARYGAERLAKQLQRRGYVVAVLDEHPNQGEREQAIEDLRRGKVQILVASDAAGRSLDVAGVSHVVNFDVPETPEDYAHRLGRPGSRAETLGDVFTLMSAEDQKDVAAIAAIERFLGRAIPRVMLPDFDYRMRPREIKQVVSYEEEDARTRRPPAGLQSAAARIATGARPAAPRTVTVATTNRISPTPSTRPAAGVATARAESGTTAARKNGVRKSRPHHPAPKKKSSAGLSKTRKK